VTQTTKLGEMSRSNKIQLSKVSITKTKEFKEDLEHNTRVKASKGKQYTASTKWAKVKHDSDYRNNGKASVKDSKDKFRGMIISRTYLS